MDPLSVLVESCVKVVVEKIVEHVPAIGRLLPRMNLPPTRRQLIRMLNGKYRRMRFIIADTQQSFYREIAKELISTIDAKKFIKDSGSPPFQPLRVGVVCGPMVYKVAEQILHAGLIAEGADYSNVAFVAMNKAAESDSFQYSASYLATFLSTLFPRSKPIAYTFNEYDIEPLDAARRSVDVLLCSVGTYPHGPKGYLQMWCERVGAKLSPDCIGDFCLHPIDAEGHAVGTEKALKDLRDKLDPFPRFTRLSDLTHEPRCTVVLPINVERREQRKQPDSTGTLTGKEAVAETALHSGIVSVCILEKALARNLVTAIGEYVLESVSEFKAESPIRVCRGRHFRDPEPVRHLRVYDRLGRTELVCPITSRDESMGLSLTSIPDIIISEDQDELAQYDQKTGTGTFEFKLDGQTQKIILQSPAVRKPGHFSRVTLQLVHKSAQEMLQDSPRRLKLWDMGCGSGVVGILAAKLLGDRLEQVYCTDVRNEAVECVRTNLANEPAARVKVTSSCGNLFACNDVPEKVDIVAFNAPFLPKGLSGIDDIDCGGETGVELAVRFSKDAKQRLHPYGRAIVGVVDYVDDGSIRASLNEAFGDANVWLEERLILYPLASAPGIHPAHEVKLRDEIERRCTYRFEVCLLGKNQFMAFKMRHYCAKNLPIK